MYIAVCVAAGLSVAAAVYACVLLRRRGRVGEGEKSEAASPPAEVREQDLFDRAPDMMASVDAVTARLFSCNQTLADRFQCSKGWILGTSVFDLYDPSSVEEARRAFQEFRRTGATHNLELVFRPKGGQPINVSLNATALRDAAGNIVRGRCVWHDITHYKENEARLRESLGRQQELLQRETMLLRELNHRVRNNLAGILGLVRICERSGKSPDEVSAAIRGKVRAMTEAHDMISHAHGQPVDLGAIVARLAAPEQNGEARIRWSGPPAPVPAAQVSAMAMILQELMTNAQKHGALAGTAGEIGIEWRLGPEQRLELTWRERGGPAPNGTGLRGIGLGLIEGLAGAELQGSCTFRFEPQGLCFSLAATLSGARWLVQPAAPPAPVAPQAGAPPAPSSNGTSPESTAAPGHAA